MPGLGWTRVRKTGWLCEDGRYIAKFNWGASGAWFLLYETYDVYQKPCADYKAFKSLKDAKRAP